MDEVNKSEVEVKPLIFDVAPHIVQDLGLNLYTSLPRVLVEFVANAYDADSPDVQITYDDKKIDEARAILKSEYDLEQTKKKYGDAESVSEISLGERTLPSDVQITVIDHGHGMSREDIQNKFLIAGRRRREEEKTVRTPENRIIMGRKGLGKLAGFGVARTVEIISRKKGENHATKITLDYDKLISKRIVQEVEIDEEKLENGGGIEPHGTKIILSRLVYEPMKSRVATISNEIGDHFSMIDSADFAITLNGNSVEPTPRSFAYAYPNPELPHNNLVEHSFETEEGQLIKYKYRIRFTMPKQQLQARERGVRVYAHKRLASAPDLLDLKTGVHGFNNSHYLDAIADADFIDDNKAVDYIATDRQSLRWESALLTPMREHLSSEMTEACKEYQKSRDTEAKISVRKDVFTKGVIDAAKMPRHRKATAYKIAATLVALSDGGLEDVEYKKQLRLIVDGLVQGNILNSLSELATSDHPDFNRIVGQVVELTRQEIGDFLKVVQGRMDGIDALQKIKEEVDFKKPDNEKILHNLLEKNPWLIDPTFAQFLTSNQTENQLNKDLSKELKIGSHVPADYDSTKDDETKELGSNKRPDLVFLLSNEALNRILIIELKSPNTPLHYEHLTQLKEYMAKADEYLKNHYSSESRIRDYKIEGYLIGSHAKEDSKAREVTLLRNEIKEYMHNAKWKVYGIKEILDRTQKAHKELWEIYEKALLEPDEEEPT